ncbi:unnamed protein product [Parnassius mnemosyne]|uniref:Uncharacterized protein n=1 Tax=Parnassius mnemosyne TaxID=213953 RepID=A0AAV1LGQ7_9NEOP
MPEINNDTIEITDIGNDSVTSLGHIPIEFCSYQHNFYVLPAFVLPYDGIIGSDFLIKLNCKINYDNNTLKVNKDEIELCFNKPVYAIAPRCETIIECSVRNPDIKEGLVLDQNPVDLLLIANCIVKVKSNSRINISVVNTSESELIVESFILFQTVHEITSLLAPIKL